MANDNSLIEHRLKSVKIRYKEERTKEKEKIFKEGNYLALFKVCIGPQLHGSFNREPLKKKKKIITQHLTFIRIENILSKTLHTMKKKLQCHNGGNECSRTCSTYEIKKKYNK